MRMTQPSDCTVKRQGVYYWLLTCVALLLDLCEGPRAMFTLDEDCVSVVLPPSAADNPEITRPLEKLRFPNNRLRVDDDEETWGKKQQISFKSSLTHLTSASSECSLTSL